MLGDIHLRIGTRNTGRDLNPSKYDFDRPITLNGLVDKYVTNIICMYYMSIW